MSRAQLDTIAGTATRSHCCPVTCAYRVDAVQHYLSYIRDLERAGEDPSEVAACKPPKRDGGGGSAGNGAAQIVDVLAAIKAIRAEHGEVNAVSVATRLCPWSATES